MEFDSVIKKRKSVNSFANKKPSWKAAIDAIESANQGPFAGNNNNLRFLIIEEEETIKKISKLSEQLWISQSQLLILICSDDTHLEDIYGDRGRIYSRQQAGSVIQTILLKLTDIGLASCWIGAYSDEILKETLKIPQHIQIEAIIPIGYENKTRAKSKPRKKSLDNSIYWENWENSKRPPVFKESRDPLAFRS